MTKTKAKAQPRYRQLAQDLETNILNGAFRAGDRLPSLRELQRRLGVSLTTVVGAYAELEEMGLIEGRAKSGYFVKPEGIIKAPLPRAAQKATAPRKIKMDSITNQVLAASLNPDMLPLGCSTLAPETMPFRRLAKMLKAISVNELQGLMQHGVSEGAAELRRELAKRYVGFAPGLTPEDIVITNGCSEAVSLALLALAKPGDVVAVESPTHFGFLQLLRELGLMVVEVPAHPETGVDLNQLEEVMKKLKPKAALLMPNFHNPLGALMPEANKKELAGLAARWRVPVIEDDIYGEMGHGNQRPSLVKGYDQDEMVITCSSFSKAVAPGLRVGWTFSGGRWLEHVQRLKCGFSLGSAPLNQHLMARFLSEGGLDRYLRKLRATVKKQVHQTAMAIQRHFPPDTRLALPPGGALLWVELPGKVDGVELHRRALQRGISIVPGAACTTGKRFNNCVRISCGTPLDERLENGIKTLGELAKVMERE